MFSKAIGVGLWVFCLWAQPVQNAWASSQSVQPTTARKATSTRVVKAQLPSQKSPKKKSQSGAASTPVQYAPSGEAMPSREKRLLRECKGRPNAGACLGYAS